MPNDSSVCIPILVSPSECGGSLTEFIIVDHDGSSQLPLRSVTNSSKYFIMSKNKTSNFFCFRSILKSTVLVEVCNLFVSTESQKANCSNCLGEQVVIIWAEVKVTAGIKLYNVIMYMHQLDNCSCW